jgi:hypothetical protein
MALQGSLEDFSLAEILQLIAIQKKSGVLRLTSPEASGVIFFEKGVIVSLADRREKKSDPLLDYFAATNKLSKEQVEQITTIRGQSKKEVTEIIITGGYLTSKQLAEAIEMHAREMLPALLSWQKGIYNFSGDDKTVAKLYFKVPMRTEALLMEGMRRIDESARIKQLYSPAAVLRRREPPDELELAAEEKWILGLVDGKRPIQEILSKSRLGEFETYEILSEFVQAGAAEVAEWSSDAYVGPGEETAGPVRKTRALVQFLTIGATLLVIIGASFVIRWTVRTLHDLPFVPSATATIRAHAGHEENVRFAAEVYRISHNSYPDGLAQLVEDGLVEEEDVRGFRYVRLKSGFALERVQETEPTDSP